ncbi:MAG TPA: ABC transporter ATP-binding protein, partial [Candidatus Limnocylindrales bacterium]|nr:ABC transporter ATP-binding protein [Candidatus Limnocylindrales bacterium]
MAGQPAGAPAATPETIIRTKGLTKRYGELTAVDRLDLDVRRGEVFGLLGPNGAGKTTTILMLLGLSEPTAGEARVDGLDPTRQPLEVKRRVGYLPDNVGFYGSMSGRQNLRYTCRLNGFDRAESEERIARLLDEVGLSDAADRPVETYSRGMKQRLGIADALVKDPSILILDEPTAAIDPIGIVEILDLIRRLSRERGLTVLLSSHLLEQVQSVCDRVGIFLSGRLVARGTVAELARTAGTSAVTIEVATAGSPETIDAVAPRV